MLFALKNAPIAFGLDISDTTVKIAQLRRSGRTFVAELIKEIIIPPGLVKNGEIQNIQQLASELIKLFSPFRKQLTDGVIASLPESKTFIQTIVIPKSDGSTLPAQLAESLPEYLPLPLEEMYQDNAVIDETNNNWQIVIGAAPKTSVDNYIQLLESMHLIPVALDIQAMAIARTLLPAKEPRYRTRAIIDIGRHHASLIIHDQNTIQFTMSLPISGEQITDNIAKELNLSTDQAEKAKIICGLDPNKCEGVLRTVLEGIVDNLIKKISEARDFYQDHFINSRDIEEIILTGGGAYLLNLDQVLSEILKVPAKLGDPWENAHIASLPNLKAPLQYSTVIGLALRGASGEETV